MSILNVVGVRVWVIKDGCHNTTFINTLLLQLRMMLMGPELDINSIKFYKGKFLNLFYRYWKKLTRFKPHFFMSIKILYACEYDSWIIVDMPRYERRETYHIMWKYDCDEHKITSMKLLNKQ